MHFQLSTILTIAPLLVSAVPTAQKPRITIPLTKRSDFGCPDGVADVEGLQLHVAYSTAKIFRGFDAYERNTGLRHPLAPATGNVKRATGELALDDEARQLWMGKISVGTPPKDYNVDFDTGSSDIFLPGPNCTNNCEGHTVYDPSASSTSMDRGQPFSIEYGDGSTVSGEQYYDTVSVSGLTATGQVLAAASQYSTGFAAENFPPDGLVGMGFQEISVSGTPSLFQTLIFDGQVDSQVFAMKLTTTGSELTLGGLNSNIYTGDITYVPVTQEGYWQTDFDGFNVNGQSVVNETACIIDSGTTLIIGDTDNVKAFYAQIPGSKDASDLGAGVYTFPCDSTLPDISFTFGGQDFPIPKDSFNYGPVTKDSNDCVGGIAADSSLDGKFWILGDVFMTNYYTVFDVGATRIGFAKLA